MKHILFLILLCFWGVIPLLQGQSLEPTLIAGAGNANQNTTHQLEWNVGEPILGTISNGTYQLEQGFFGSQSIIAPVQGTGIIAGDCNFVCAGDTTPTYSYSVSGYTNATAYQWTIVPSNAATIIQGQNTATINVKFDNPTATYAYFTVLPSNSSGSGTMATSDSIMMDTACVWPGDINNDGMVTNVSTINWVSDVLSLEKARAEVGHAPFMGGYWNPSSTYNYTMNQRNLPCTNTGITTKTDWWAYPMKDWLKPNGTPFNYDDYDGTIRNLKYADADGDGHIEFWNSNYYRHNRDLNHHTITDSDVLFHHLEKTHKGNNNTYNKVIEDISIVHHKDSIASNGDNLVLSIYAGNPNKLLKMRSVALKVYFDIGLYKRPYVEYANSHFGTANVHHADYIHVNEDTTETFAYIVISRDDYANAYFTGQPICNLVCDVPVAWLNGNQKNAKNSSSDITISIDDAGGLDSLGSFIPLSVSTITTNVTIPNNDSIQARVLQPCWNMIALDVVPTDSSVTTVFADLIADGTLEYVVGYDAGIGPKFFDPNLPSFFNTLSVLERGKGYFVKTNTLDTLIVNGVPIPQPFNWNLQTGWNLVGYLKDTTKAVTDYFATQIANNDLRTVSTYENCSPTFYSPQLPSFLNTLDSLKNGYGYWLNMINNSTLTKSGNRNNNQKNAINCTPIATSESGVMLGTATIGGQPAESGDIIIAFDPNDNPAGLAEVTINSGSAFINVTIFGDDAATTGVDEGITNGEDFYIKIFDVSANQESALLGPFSGWTNTNGTPMAAFSHTTVYDFTLNNLRACNNPPPLPVECLSFTTYLNEKKEVELSWATASEENNDFFSVQRSADGIEFQTIATIQGAGTIQEEQRYKWTDKQPLNGANYYQIQQTDFDGTIGYCGKVESVEIEIEATSPNTAIQIYPNPTRATFTIDYTGQVIESLELYNSIGQLIQPLPINDNGITQFNMNALPSGIYIVRINNNISKKVIKID